VASVAAISAARAVEIDLDKKFGFFNCQIGRCNLFILKAEDKSLLTNNNTCA
jgi:hypothetical protein